MVPPPRFHMVRFHGVLAPNAALRKEVVASARPSAPTQVAPSRAPLQLPLFGELFNVGDDSEANGRRKPWAWLLRHVFAIDVTVCPKCAGTMRWRMSPSYRMQFAKDWPAQGSRRVDRQCA